MMPLFSVVENQFSLKKNSQYKWSLVIDIICAERYNKMVNIRIKSFSNMSA